MYEMLIFDFNLKDMKNCLYAYTKLYCITLHTVVNLKVDAYECLFGRFLVCFVCACDSDEGRVQLGLCLQIYQTSKCNRLKCLLFLNLYVINFQAVSLNTFNATAKR